MALSTRGFLLACLIGLCVSLWIGLRVPERRGDFDEFYAAGKLVGSGQLYNWDRVQDIERAHGRVTVPFGRLPFYAVLFKPLTALPYLESRVAWAMLNGLALAIFALLWPTGRRADLILILCWSCPAALLLSTGQDTALFLAFATIGLRLLQLERNFLAGLAFSLCAAKFHLALGIPVFLLARCKWTAMAGGLAGGLEQLAISFAAEGRHWPDALIRLSSVADFSPAPAKMPNLLGITFWLPYGVWVEAALAVAVLAALWFVSRRAALPIGLAAALAAGMLTGHHAYVYDTLLLLPVLVIALQMPLPEILRYGTLLLCVPIPYLLLLKAGAMLVAAQILITGFALALLTFLFLRMPKASSVVPEWPLCPVSPAGGAIRWRGLRSLY